MISIREALEQCLSSVPAVKVERVRLDDALQRVLAENIIATSPLPPWDNSAMDGYAVRSVDTAGAHAQVPEKDVCAAPEAQPTEGVHLRIIDTIAAGAVSKQTVESGQAAKIMTGAPLPKGADAVVMREHTTELDGRVIIHRAASCGQHIRKEGENVARGEKILDRGTPLTPAAIGLCAAVGLDTLLVSQRPTIGIVSTGDEIIPPGTPLGPGQIHSSNRHALAGLIRQAGAIPVDCGIAPDDLTKTREAFENASKCDVILSTGGVSVGDFDYVRQAMNDLGAEMQFWKVRVKPGKPLAFGIVKGTPTFGLPGNPVSCQVGFHQFVRPWIRLSLGDPNPYHPVIEARIQNPHKKKAGRAELGRVVVRWNSDGWTAEFAGKQGSGNQTSMVQANGLLLLPEEAVALSPGDLVQVQLFGAALPAFSSPSYPW